MIVKTSSGYQVHLRDYLTFGQHRELQALLLKDVKVNLQNQNNIEMPALIMQEAEKLAFGFLVEKIVKDGVEVSGDLYAEVMGWKREDGQKVIDAINKMTNEASGEKK